MQRVGTKIFHIFGSSFPSWCAEKRYEHLCPLFVRQLGIERGLQTRHIGFGASKKGFFMLGIEDPYVAMAYILCLASTALCVIYGLINWNRGEQRVEQEDITWIAHEKKAEEEI
jgi:hypothetical protein